MVGTFQKRMTYLGSLVGRGNMTGKLIVDQVYAQNQHESLHFKHPRGGKAKYLEEPFLQHYRTYCGYIADSLLDSGPTPGMVKAMEALSEQVTINAPVLHNYLRQSGHPIVYDDGVTVYNRPPLVHRLTEAEIRAQTRNDRDYE